MLRSPYRVASPPEDTSASDHEADAYAKKLARRGYVAAARAIAIACALAAPFAVALKRSPRAAAATGDHEASARLRAEHASTRIALHAARERASVAQARFEGAVRDAGDAERCSFDVPDEATVGRAKRTLPLTIVTRSELDAGGVASASVSEMLRDAARAQAHLDAGRLRHATLYVHALASPKRLVRDYVLVATKMIEPKSGPNEASYTPGLVEGRVYVYDFASERVVCGADVRASSSPAIGYSFAPAHDAPAWLGKGPSLEASLAEDFRFNVEREVIRALR